MYAYEANEDLLKEKVILITGAGDGIGKTLALSYAKHGATVILTGRTVAKLERVYDEIEQKGFPQPAIIPLNLEGASETDYLKISEVIENEFGQLDGLVLNAAILGSLTSVEQYEAEVWQQVMQVNVNSSFLLTKALLPTLQKAEHASVIFTTSSVGRKGRAFWGAYAVSKFACEGMAQVLAHELEEKDHTGIRVNTINPGATRTNMRANAYPAENPMSHPAPSDIMPLYLYLMGNDSIGTTGQSLDAQG
jgi:NAD(P)-dependent dehydrogenase (short-subunit alcohol dehydrogenase family)